MENKLLSLESAPFWKLISISNPSKDAGAVTLMATESPALHDRAELLHIPVEKSYVVNMSPLQGVDGPLSQLKFGIFFISVTVVLVPIKSAPVPLAEIRGA